MAKKKKKGAQPKKKPIDSAQDLSFNPFAAKLKGLKSKKKKEAAQERHIKVEKARQVHKTIKEADRRQREVIGRASALRGDDIEMTADELFAQAVSNMDAHAIHKGKFMGQGPDTQHVRIKEERRPSPKVIEALGEPDDPYHDEVATFEEIMDHQGVVPMENKIHVPDPGIGLNTERLVRFKQQDYSKNRHALREEALEAFLKSEGPELSKGQLQLLHEYRKQANSGADLPELNVRGESRELALRQLELGVLQAGVRGDRFLRVVTGKGLGSVGEPVLKRSVVEWCLDEGADLVVDCAPEILPDGTFGCIIVCVRRRRRR